MYGSGVKRQKGPQARAFLIPGLPSPSCMCPSPSLRLSLLPRLHLCKVPSRSCSDVQEELSEVPDMSCLSSPRLTPILCLRGRTILPWWQGPQQVPEEAADKSPLDTDGPQGREGQGLVSLVPQIPSDAFKAWRAMSGHCVPNHRNRSGAQGATCCVRCSEVLCLILPARPWGPGVQGQVLPLLDTSPCCSSPGGPASWEQTRAVSRNQVPCLASGRPASASSLGLLPSLEGATPQVLIQL